MKNNTIFIQIKYKRKALKVLKNMVYKKKTYTNLMMVFIYRMKLKNMLKNKIFINS